MSKILRLFEGKVVHSYESLSLLISPILQLVTCECIVWFLQKNGFNSEECELKLRYAADEGKQKPGA